MNTKKNFIYIYISIAIFIIGIIFCLRKMRKQSIISKNSKGEVIKLSNISPEEMLSKMSLEDKIGQMLMVGFWGTEPDYYINKMINQRNIGGVILMKYNIKDGEQVKNLISSLQEKSLVTNLGIPLFISVDQEGGVVSRIQIKSFSEFTSQCDIKNSEEAYNIAKRRGAELSKLGININYSPVLDYIKNKNSFLYNRVFRGSPDDIASFGTAMIKGYRDSGIIAVPKHFPGYTDDSINPHKNLPIVKIDRDKLIQRVEPFVNIIGNADPKFIMISHILFSNIDSENPSSLSKIFIQDILREKLNYQGIVITDDMEMDALLKNYSVAEAAVRAVQAGNDILLYSSTPEKQVKAYNAIVQAVMEGKIDKKQIDNSVLRILKLKKKFIVN